MLLTANIELAKNFSSDKINNELFEGFNDKQKNGIILVFINLIKYDEIMLKFKRKLINTPLFSYYEYFEYLRNINSGIVSGKDILGFLNMSNTKVGEKEVI